MKIKGFTYGYDGRRGDYRTPEAALSMDRLAAPRGLKVCMKPIVNCLDGVWRAHIDFPEREWGDGDYWKEWFASYKAFLCHYAEIAEETGCEMFCVGCEMLGTERKEKLWRQTIAAVREVYRGPLVYNTNHGKEEDVRWRVWRNFPG